VPPLFNSYTYADVLADLQTVKARGFGSIKTYGVGTSLFSGNGNNLDSNQYNVQAANALGLGVYLGANLQFANGGLDLVRTKMEIDLAIKQAATYPGTVKTLIIGNESIGRERCDRSRHGFADGLCQDPTVGERFHRSRAPRHHRSAMGRSGRAGEPGVERRSLQVVWRVLCPRS
jgi:hypothetical protein